MIWLGDNVGGCPVDKSRKPAWFPVRMSGCVAAGIGCVCLRGCCVSVSISVSGVRRSVPVASQCVLAATNEMVLVCPHGEDAENIPAP